MSDRAGMEFAALVGRLVAGAHRPQSVMVIAGRIGCTTDEAKWALQRCGWRIRGDNALPPS